jgi:zinc/manganese transport system substrate-binding protein
MQSKFTPNKFLPFYKFLVAGFIPILLLISVTACVDSDQTDKVTGEKIRVVATTTQIADMLKNVGQEKVEITILAKGNSRFSEYIPTKPDLEVVKTAGVIFKNGAGLDNWLDEIYQSTNSKAMVVDLSEGVKLLTYEFQSSSLPAPNPYYWLNSANGKIMVDHITRVLQMLDKSYSQDYALNSRAYQFEVDQVVDKARALINEIPVDKRKLLTGSEAMEYFGREFGLEFLEPLNIQSCNEANLIEPLMAEELARVKETSAVFFDRLCNPQITQKLSREAGLKVILNLCTESLSLPGREVDTYLRMLLNNALVISLGLR